ncbi:MAG: inositol monophosphatase family protein [Cytophagales bacterium]
MNLQNITEQVITIAKEAGNFISNERKNFDPATIEQKGHSANLVSYVDKEAEKILVNTLKKIIPSAGFITEEGTVAQRSNEEYCWVIDPLDGTTNFLHNVPLFSTSIGLLKGDELVSGVVYDISRDEMFSGWKNGGAYLNEKQIKVSGAQSINESLIATGFPYYQFENMQNYLSILVELMKDCHGLRRCGSAAIDLAWVAAGRFDGYFEYNINSYDIAAGCLILSEAGGISTNFKGGSEYLFARNVIASNSKIHQQFQEIVARNWGK